MKYEPAKVIKSLDMTCYDFGENSAPLIMGTSAAFASLNNFLQTQENMAAQFGSATREIIFKKPWMFSEPFSQQEIDKTVSTYQHSKISFYATLKIKLDSNHSGLSLLFQDNHLVATCCPATFQEAMNCCQMRLHNQTHGCTFLAGTTANILCPPLGDWLGIE